MISRLATYILLMMLCLPALATSPLTYDRINLSVSSGDQVENDTLVAVLFVQKEGNDPGQLSSQVNLAVSKGIKLAKKHERIKAETNEYRTSPLYNKQNISGWRVRQSIRLESQDAALLSQLIGELQGWMAVASISYSISPERRQKAEQRLIVEAVAAFRSRAAMLTKELGRREYRLVEMNVNTSGVVPPPYRARGVAMAMQAEAAPPPTLEPGTQRVEVAISATIELKP